MSTPRCILLIFGVWLAAMGVGVWLDGPVARWAHWQAIDRDHPGNVLMKMGGDWRFTLAVAAALVTWHRDSWRAAGLLALSALLGGFLYTVCKWVAGRQRPVKLIDPLRFNPFPNGWQGFFDEPNMSFPSGHTCLAFATAASLGICIPRWRVVFFALAAVVAAERVAENAHYLTDVIAGAGLGTLSAYVVYWALHRVGRPGELLQEQPAPPLTVSVGQEPTSIPEMVGARG